MEHTFLHTNTHTQPTHLSLVVSSITMAAAADASVVASISSPTSPSSPSTAAAGSGADRNTANHV